MKTYCENCGAKVMFLPNIAWICTHCGFENGHKKLKGAIAYYSDGTPMLYCQEGEMHNLTEVDISLLISENMRLKETLNASEESRINTEMNLEYVTAELIEMKEANQWIPCSERLPENCHTVIVCWGKPGYLGVNSAAYYKDSDTWSMRGCEVRPTHWKPLPEPPQ